MRARRRATQQGTTERVSLYRRPALTVAGFLTGALLSVGLFQILGSPARSSPVDAAKQLALAEACEARGARDQAEAHYLRASKLNPGDPRPYFHLAQISRARGHNEVAIAQYRQALKADPTFGEAAHYLAIQLREASIFGEAAQILESTLRRNPANAGLRCNLARTYLMKGDADSAVKEFRRAIPDVSQKPEAYFFLGRALELQEEYEQAEQAYRSALKWNPQLQRAWYALAQLARRAGEEDKAQELLARFEKARALKDRINGLKGYLSRHPTDVRALIEYAQALLDGGRPEEALGPLGVAAKLDESNPAVPPLVERAKAAIRARAR